MVLGLPIGRIVGQYFGWRTTFFAIGMGALITRVSDQTAAKTAQRTLRLAEKSSAADASTGADEHLFADRDCGDRPLHGLQLFEPFVQVVAGFSANFATVLLLIPAARGLSAASCSGSWAISMRLRL